jgi:transposase
LEANALAAGKKNATRWRAHLVFVDESGFLLIPTLRRTWAPRGQTPRVSHRYRHDRFSVISGLSVSPVRRRVGLYFRCHRHNIRHADVCEFFRHLLRHLRGHVILLLDNASIHKGEPIRELRHRYPRLHLEFLPPYTPELNPDEGVWANTKARLANGRPDDLDTLYRRLYATLRSLKQSPRRLRRCVHQSELSLFA